MKKWITEITIDNYKAFKGQYDKIMIPVNHNVLIYGENGSGKSSLYNLLNDFFQSSDNSSVKFDVNYFEKNNGNNWGKLELITNDIDDNNNISPDIKYIFGEPDTLNNHKVPEIQLANKINGFLDYKKLLKTHFIETQAGENPNIFRLVIEDLLSSHKIPSVFGGVSNVELKEEWDKIKYNVEQLDRRYYFHHQTIGILPNFESSLKKLLSNIFTEFKILFQTYFDKKIDIDVILSPFNYNSSIRYLTKELFLEIKYAGVSIPSYQYFLNEARLSAIAVCLYLSALKTHAPEISNLQILYLDDIFIGLDTSNRFPLLELINEEFIKKDYQVFISTYDREWYEMARYWFNTKKIPLKCLELYVEDNENPTIPDYPIIIPHKDNIDKAKAYFKAKDYPAAGNYIRKECESIIKSILPKTFKIDVNGSPIDELEPLMQKLEDFIEDCGITKPQELIDAMKIYRKALLNPTSHGDIKSPIFKREIEEAFKIADKLKALPELQRIQICNSGDIFRYENPGINYSMQIELTTNLFLIEQNGTKSFSNHKFKIVKWSWNSIEYATDNAGTVMSKVEIDNVCDQNRTLEDIFQGINRSTGIAIPPNLYSEIRIGATGTLQDLLN